MPDKIFAAVRDGDTKRVRALLEEKAKRVSAKDGDGNRPLHHAASKGRIDIAEILLDAGADVDGENKAWEWRPVVHASWNNHIEMVKLLIKRGADVTQSGGQPIHYAGQKKHKEICRILVEAGAVDDLIDPPDSETVALFRAAYSYDAPAVAACLEANPDLVHARDKEGRTALHEAGTGGAVDVIRVLIDAGADINAASDDGDTPMGRAASHRQGEACALLREAGAVTDIFTACDLGWADEVRKILEKEPSLARSLRDGHPLIESVCEAGWIDVGRVLVDGGAEVDIFTACSLGLRDKVAAFLADDANLVQRKRRLFDYEALHCAAECGHLDIVELLLDSGAAVDGRNEWNFTPLHLAVIAAREQMLCQEHFKIIKLLVDRGGDPRAVDDYKRTPLTLANGNIEWGTKRGEDLKLYEEVKAFIESL